MRVIYAAEQILIVTKQQTRTNNTNSNIEEQKHRMEKKQTRPNRDTDRNEPKRKKRKNLTYFYCDKNNYADRRHKLTFNPSRLRMQTSEQLVRLPLIEHLRGNQSIALLDFVTHVFFFFSFSSSFL